MFLFFYYRNSDFYNYAGKYEQKKQKNSVFLEISNKYYGKKYSKTKLKNQDNLYVILFDT